MFKNYINFIMANYLTYLALLTLPMVLTAQDALPYSLSKTQVDTIFNDFLWSMSQVDASYAANTNNPKLPYNLTLNDLSKLYATFVQSLWSTTKNAPKQLPGLTFNFALPTSTTNNNTNNNANNNTNNNTNNNSGSTTPATSPAGFVYNASQASRNSAMAQLIFQKFNKYRAEQSLPALVWNDDVANRAYGHDQYQAQANNISHDNFSSRAAGFMYANENVAYIGGMAVTDEDGSDQFMKNWKNSPGHNTNMLATQPNATGIAVLYYAPLKRYYATMINVKTK